MRELELSLLKACPVRCAYCPQDLLIAVSRDMLSPRMTAVTLAQVIENASAGMKDGEQLQVHWAGFTEPIKHPGFLSLLLLVDGFRTVSDHVLYTTGEGITEDIVWCVAQLPVAVSFHIDPRMEGDVWPLIDSGLIRRVLPKAWYNVVAAVSSRSKRAEIRRRVGGKVKFSRCISRAANIDRSKAAVTHDCEVTCVSVGKRKRPVVIPDGTAVACCNDYGLKLKLGNLAEQTWNQLDYSDVLERQKHPCVDSICHTDCHKAKRL